MNETTGEPTYTHVCEICGSTDDTRLTADPDRGGLRLCLPCRVLFGFEEGEPVTSPLFEEIPY